MSGANHPTPDQGITCKHGLPHGHPCSQCGAEAIAARTSNPKTVKPPYDVALPKITAEIWEAYQDEEFIEDLPRWGWTQAAVDFACEIVRPAIWAEIERLTRELETERGRLAGCGVAALGYFNGCAPEYDSASLQDVLRLRSDRDRLRALVQRAHTIIGIREAAHQTHKGAAWLEQAQRELNGEPASAHETTASPQAPIARVTVKADRCYAVELYTPGLPPGEHDLYCEPEAVAPMMREKRAYYETHDPPHCPTCDYGTSPSKANECKPGFTQACSLFGDDPDAPGCCSYCGQPREAHPQKGPV